MTIKEHYKQILSEVLDNPIKRIAYMVKAGKSLRDIKNPDKRIKRLDKMATIADRGIIFRKKQLNEIGDTLAGRVALLRYAKIRNDQAREFVQFHQRDLDRYQQSIMRVKSAMRNVQSDFTPQNMDAFMRATKGMEGWKKMVLQNQRQIDKRRTGINRALTILNNGKPYQGPPKQ